MIAQDFRLQRVLASEERSGHYGLASMAGASEGAGGGVWESNPPVPTSSRRTGFEDQESHQTLFASIWQYSTAAAAPHTTDSHSRDAAFAPLRIDCGLRPCLGRPCDRGRSS